jgi:hypothetical protein
MNYSVMYLLNQSNCHNTAILDFTSHGDPGLLQTVRCLTVESGDRVTYFVVNIRNIRKGWANKRDWDHRPMAAVTGAVDITLQLAIVAAVYIIGQGLVDTWGD